MTHKYGKENLSALARDSGIGAGSTTRIKLQQTAIGFDVLEKVAASFGLDAWQLLVPGITANNPPVIRVAGENERTRLAAAVEKAKATLDDFVSHANTRPGDLPE